MPTVFQTSNGASFQQSVQCFKRRWENFFQYSAEVISRKLKLKLLHNYLSTKTDYKLPKKDSWTNLLEKVLLKEDCKFF